MRTSQEAATCPYSKRSQSMTLCLKFPACRAGARVWAANGQGKIQALDLRQRMMQAGMKGSAGSIRALSLDEDSGLLASAGLDRYNVLAKSARKPGEGCCVRPWEQSVQTLLCLDSPHASPGAGCAWLQPASVRRAAAGF